VRELVLHPIEIARVERPLRELTHPHKEGPLPHLVLLTEQPEDARASTDRLKELALAGIAPT
jgi:hypothetical protein